jgi:hypothetical protein
MRCFVLFVSFLLFHSSVFSQIRINEIYYDHPGRDDGHEFIELVNLGSVPGSLSGYALEFHDGNTEGWRVLWAGAQTDSIAPGGLFVVGGEFVTPPPDRTIGLVMQNGPDAVRLFVNDSDVDRVGYGELIGSQYYEGESAPDVSAGLSLGRYPDGYDTDNNAVDFRPLTPSPGRFNRPHRDVALSLASGTGSVVVIDEGISDELRVKVLNRGLEQVIERSVAIDIVDSFGVFVEQLDSTVNPRMIAVDDSIEVVFALTLEPGYHHLTVIATYEDDDRPGNNTLALLRRVGHQPLLVSEVMSFPAVGCPQYVELFNASVRAYEFSGHWLRDGAHQPVVITSAITLIPPRGHIVVTDDESSLRVCFPSLDEDLVVETEGSWPLLNHSGSGVEADSIVVLDRFRLPVERVAYPPQAADSRGRSLERVDLYPGERPHVWILSSATGGGSPGRENRRGIFDAPRAKSISVVPNPFDATGGGEVLVTVPAKSEPTRALVQLFDVRGRRVCEIGSSTALPYVFVWGGRDEHGRLITSGIYIVACEFYGLETGSRVVERVVLGCGRKNR